MKAIYGLGSGTSRAYWLKLGGLDILCISCFVFMLSIYRISLSHS